MGIDRDGAPGDAIAARRERVQGNMHGAAIDDGTGCFHIVAGGIAHFDALKADVRASLNLRAISLGALATTATVLGLVVSGRLEVLGFRPPS